MMDLADIGFLNEGELRLTRIANALEMQKLPDPDDAEALIDAVALLRCLAREDMTPQSRHKEFLKKLGVSERQGRKSHDEDINAQMLGREQSKTYWRIRLSQNVSKTEARRLAAEELQLSGKFPDGKPSEWSIRDAVNRYPREGISVFRMWVLIDDPTEDKQQKARAEIIEAVEKADRKT